MHRLDKLDYAATHLPRRRFNWKLLLLVTLFAAAVIGGSVYWMMLAIRSNSAAAG